MTPINEPPSRPATLPPITAPPTSVAHSGGAPLASEVAPRDKKREPIACEDATILARVGRELVLGGDVLPAVREMISAKDSAVSLKGADNIPEELRADVLREILLSKLLPQRINLKLMYCDALRGIPAENLPRIKKQLGEQFEKMEVARLIEKTESGSRLKLEAKLREMGTSLDRMKRAYQERILAQQWALQQLTEEEEITHEDMLAYYREHKADYETPTRARWEQMSALFEKHPEKQGAREAIAAMGNLVVRQGKPFAEVARAHSEGAAAAQGGARSWAAKGALVSRVLDDARFSLPVGQMSQIIEDDKGFHIIRVVQREEAACKSFAEVQTEIREKITGRGRAERQERYLVRLRKEIPVWTIFDDKPLEERITSIMGRKLR
ncbi:MAG: peptidyl-prolyl cis-trans isomerase [Planctomycetes bacterium]|nr:peptidyl-prolyl cis-trans isomerase [Planctomycetota bacterium]